MHNDQQSSVFDPKLNSNLKVLKTKAQYRKYFSNNIQWTIYCAHFYFYLHFFTNNTVPKKPIYFNCRKRNAKFIQQSVSKDVVRTWKRAEVISIRLQPGNAELY